MSKKSDDSIERIFRQALTQYDTTFREDDWLKMEKMLNEEANRRAAVRSRRIKGIAFALIGLTGLIIAVYFLALKTPSSSIAKLNDSSIELQAIEDLRKSEEAKKVVDSSGLHSITAYRDSSSNQPAKTSNQTKDVAPEFKVRQSLKSNQVNGHQQPEPEITSRTFDAKSAGKRKANSSKTQNVTDSLATSTRLSTLDQNTNPSQNMAERSYPKKTNGEDEDQFAIAKTDERTDLDSKDDSEPNPGSKKEDASDPLETSNYAVNPSARLNSNPPDSVRANSNNLPQAINNLNSNKGMTSNSMDTVAPTIKRDSVLDKEIASGFENTDSTKSAQDDPPNEETINPIFRWSVGVVFSPEFSTTSLNSYSSPGESVGLRIGYQIGKRLSINTGLIRSNKKYVGKGTDYSPRNPAYWQIRTNGVVPDEIDSRCLVYELPLGVQFDAVQTERSRLFLSAAISSYFMMSQAYDYTFDTPNPGADTGWRSSGSESYWFKIGIISAGYERYINRSFALGIEPYLKVSLAEIGWPEIKLFSAGAYVTLRYRFHERRDNE